MESTTIHHACTSERHIRNRLIQFIGDISIKINFSAHALCSVAEIHHYLVKTCWNCTKSCIFFTTAFVYFNHQIIDNLAFRWNFNGLYHYVMYHWPQFHKHNSLCTVPQTISFRSVERQRAAIEPRHFNRFIWKCHFNSFCHSQWELRHTSPFDRSLRLDGYNV